MEGSMTVAFLAAVLIIALILILVINLTKRGQRPLNIDLYRSRWLTIEQSLGREQPASYQLCILNADKLLDQALRDRGIKGETMGERMKTARETWKNRDALWTAHKLRNRIAHETDAHITYEQARAALSGFKQALKDVGAI